MNCKIWQDFIINQDINLKKKLNKNQKCTNQNKSFQPNKTIIKRNLTEYLGNQYHKDAQYLILSQMI